MSESNNQESIDTPEFRELLAQLLDAAEKAEKANDPMQYKPARDRFITHIDAQLAQASKAGRAYQKKVDDKIIARQHQDSKPTDLSKRLRKVYDDTLAFDSKLLIEAADEIERQAAQQKQGDAVRDSERWRFFIGTLAECEGEAEAKHITKMIDTARGLSEQGREAINAAVASAALRATNTGKEQK